MSIFGSLFGGQATDPAQDAAAATRLAEWDTALNRNHLPPFVTQRLDSARQGQLPWMSTMTPAELLLARSHGIRPVATVSGTCWYHYGFSWTNGHAEGWAKALARLKQEAVAAGANAVVDVKLRTVQLAVEDSMDFTVIGTAVRMETLPASKDPAIATVPAIEFARLLEAGIVPTGIAVGGHYEWHSPRSMYTDGRGLMYNTELTELSQFWDRVRKRAVKKLEQDVRAQHGNGVLGHTHFGQLLKPEGQATAGQFLGRHIVIGTTVHCEPKAGFRHGTRTVIDMRDEESPLLRERPHGHNSYAHTDEEGSI